MKQYLSSALALACIVLLISFIVTKRNDNAQHESDAGTIDDFSNRLDAAQSQLAIGKGTILEFSNSLNVVSNSLDESRAASLAFSNHLVEAGSTIALDAQQITSLNRRVAEMASENQTLAGRVMDLTNQMTGLMKQSALTEAALDEANKDHALLENRFRRDVAARLVVERKFANLSELQAQIEKLKEFPFEQVSAGSIYAGLDVEVKSNSFHVIAPN